jgi:hypothetical protein
MAVIAPASRSGSEAVLGGLSRADVPPGRRSPAALLAGGWTDRAIGVQVPTGSA